MRSTKPWGQFNLPLKTEAPLDTLVRRSTLIVPVNVPRFVEKAKTAGADAVQLDLEDSIPPAEKDRARGLLKGVADVLRDRGFELHVRINNPFEMAIRDIQAAVAAGVDGLFIQKLDDPDKVLFIDRYLAAQEILANVPPGSLQIGLSIDVPIAFFRLEQILSASDRVTTVFFSSEDIGMQLGVEPSDAGMERFLGNATVVLAGGAFGAQPQGLLGNVANYRDLPAFEDAARRSAAFGFKGAAAIHPDQVPILNRAFSPAPKQLEWAQKVVATLEQSGQRGAAGVEGRMVDAPTAVRAQNLLKRMAAIEKRERLLAARRR